MMRVRYILLFASILFSLIGNVKIVRVRSLADLQEGIIVPETIINVKKSIDLGGAKFSIPEGVILKVNANLSNGTIEGNATKIEIGKKGKFSNVAFDGSFNTQLISYRSFGKYYSETELLRAMFNLTFNNIAQSTLILEPKRIYNIEYHKLPYARAIYEYENVANKTIVGNDAIINDQRSRTQIGYSSYDGVFLFSNCNNITIDQLNYQNLNEDFIPVKDDKGNLIHEAGIENQLGYIGASYILLQNDCSDIHVTSDIVGARYGIKSGDYSMFWLCGDYGVKNSTFSINAKRTGYPVAIEIGDSLNINVTSDTHHRACYLCGVSNSTIKVRAKNIMIAPIHCLLSDTHYSKGDKKNAKFKACYNLDVDFIELGSEIATAGDPYCVAFQTYDNEPFYGRKQPLEWHDIKVEITKEHPAPKVGLFTFSRGYAQNANDPLSVKDVFCNITINATDSFGSTQWAARIRTSDVAKYENVTFNVNAPKSNIISDNANAYSFDFSESQVASFFYSGKATANKGKIGKVVENKTTMKAKGHTLVYR